MLLLSSMPLTPHSGIPGWDFASPPVPPHALATWQVDAREVEREFQRRYLGRVLALSEACVLGLPCSGCDGDGAAAREEGREGGPKLLLRVTATNTLDRDAQEEHLNYHCYRGGAPAACMANEDAAGAFAHPVGLQAPPMHGRARISSRDPVLNERPSPTLPCRPAHPRDPALLVHSGAAGEQPAAAG